MLAFIGLSNVYAQVGIGTEQPKTTLDVVGDESNTDVADGLKVPSITLAQLDAKASVYGADQNGAIVFVSDVTASPTQPETNEIKEIGFYFYDAPNDIWKSVAAGSASTATVVNDCETNGFVGNFEEDNDTSRSFSVTVTNNSFADSTLEFNSSDLNLTGVSGQTVGTPTGTPVLTSGTLGEITLNPGDEVIVEYPITGAPTGFGTLVGEWSNLALSCTKTIEVDPIPAVISSLDNCGNPSVTGMLQKGTKANENNVVSADINYSGGNEALYSSQSISSSGVTGLTASLPAGTLENGNGTLTYDITGIPDTAGSADFNISIGGQSCIFSITVTDPCSGVTAPSGYDLIAAGGNCWLDKNLGATTVTATPRSDYTSRTAYVNAEEDSFGDLYQWGRRADGHEKRNSNVINGDVTSNLPIDETVSGGAYEGNFIVFPNSPGARLWTQNGFANSMTWQTADNTGNNPCPNDFRLPSPAEFVALDLNGWDDAFEILKLPLGGLRSNSSGVFSNKGKKTEYWSNDLNANDKATTLRLRTSIEVNTGKSNDVNKGNPVRCISNQ